MCALRTYVLLRRPCRRGADLTSRPSLAPGLLDHAATPQEPDFSEDEDELASSSSPTSDEEEEELEEEDELMSDTDPTPAQAATPLTDDDFSADEEEDELSGPAKGAAFEWGAHHGLTARQRAAMGDTSLSGDLLELPAGQSCLPSADSGGASAGANADISSILQSTRV